MPTDIATIDRALIVNDEANDSTGQLAPGEEALDGDSNAVITVVRATRNPVATDIRPFAQLWINTTNTANFYWSRGGGLWYQFRNSATVPAHQATHRAGGSDPLPWTTIHGQGTLAARPAAAASNAGYYYGATDTKQLFRSTGTAWEVVAGTELNTEYTHVQSTPSTSWVVTHNLGRMPKTVSIRDSANQVVGGGIIHVSVNQLTLSFGHPFSGTAVVG